VGLQPRDGDIVVERQALFPMTFTIRAMPEKVPLAVSARETALRLARHWARAHEVDLWYAEHGVIRRLETYSSTRSDPSSVQEQAMPNMWSA